MKRSKTISGPEANPRANPPYPGTDLTEIRGKKNALGLRPMRRLCSPETEKNPVIYYVAIHYLESCPDIRHHILKGIPLACR